jgi:hypothetical protein
MRGLRAAERAEYGRNGVLGWAQDHALVCAVAALCGWLAVIYAVLTTVISFSS